MYAEEEDFKMKYLKENTYQQYRRPCNALVSAKLCVRSFTRERYVLLEAGQGTCGFLGDLKL